LRGGWSALLPDAKRTDRAAHPLGLRSCRRILPGAFTALEHGHIKPDTQ